MKESSLIIADHFVRCCVGERENGLRGLKHVLDLVKPSPNKHRGGDDSQFDYNESFDSFTQEVAMLVEKYVNTVEI